MNHNLLHCPVPWTDDDLNLVCPTCVYVHAGVEDDESSYEMIVEEEEEESEMEDDMEV